jgi:hypothetical protein
LDPYPTFRRISDPDPVPDPAKKVRILVNPHHWVLTNGCTTAIGI